MNGKQILLIIGGGIAAYKCLDLIRRLRERGATPRIVMTKAASEFVTPLSVSALAGDRVFRELFDLNDENEIGHIRLARECDLIVVAPATADLLAKMAHGLANDLATNILLATTAPVLAAPAMNPKMWLHAATQRNVAQLASDGISFVGPGVGEMAESNEAGPGRLAEVPEILDAITATLAAPRAGRKAAPKAATASPAGILNDRHVLITAGPTHEPIDPVRYIANRSSGKQGYAIAAAAAAAGARVTLISGPTNLPTPPGVKRRNVETAEDMLAATLEALPADIAFFAAAVADWRVASAANEKIKKAKGAKATAKGRNAPQLELVENPDILKTVGHMKAGRPALVVGFAAETENVVAHGKAKLSSKGCDWIVANDVSTDAGITSGGVMGGDKNQVHLISPSGVEDWPVLTKEEVAARLVQQVAAQLARLEPSKTPAKERAKS